MNKNNSLKEKEEEVIVNQLIEGFNQLDQLNEISTPNLQWFQETIELEKKRIKKRIWLDLVSFILVAVCILTMVISITYRQPVFFLYFQLLGVALLPLAINQTRKKVINNDK